VRDVGGSDEVRGTVKRCLGFNVRIAGFQLRDRGLTIEVGCWCRRRGEGRFDDDHETDAQGVEESGKGI
jgi:hypothetical protein